MGERLAGKTAIIVGAGQTPGETIGNGRAMSILFAREGAEVMCVDHRLDSAEETVKMVADELKTAGFTIVGSQEVLYVPDSSELDNAFGAGKAMAYQIRK